MEIPWRFDGETMERPWSDPRPPDHQNDPHFDTFSILSEGPRTLRILSDGPGPFRKKHETTITPSHRVPGPSEREGPGTLARFEEQLEGLRGPRGLSQHHQLNLVKEGIPGPTICL